MTLALLGTNLADRKSELVKVLAFPFDYRQEGRRVQASLMLAY